MIFLFTEDKKRCFFGNHSEKQEVNIDSRITEMKPLKFRSNCYKATKSIDVDDI